MEPSAETRFWARVEKTDSCWNWTGEFNNQGYGRLAFGSQPHGKRRRVFAHRLSLEIAGRPADENAVVMHVCDNPKCVNPAHLRVGTQLENIRDSKSKGRNNVGQRNGRARLKTEDVRRIRKMIAGGSTNVEIAAALNFCNRALVADIRSGRRWGGVY